MVEKKETPIKPEFDIKEYLGHDDINEFDLGPTNPEEAALYDKIVKFQKDCYNARAVTHKDMVALGDVNTEDNIAKRVALLHDIDNFTKIVNYLHQQKLSWKETGIAPDISILDWKPVEEIELPKPIIKQKREYKRFAA